MKYHIIAFGCQFNKADAEKISQLFIKKGYKQSSIPEEADLIVILMCSVRQKSVNKAMNRILQFSSDRWKTEAKNKVKNCNPKSKIIATGCILNSDKKTLENLGVEIKKFKDFEKFPPITGLITIGKGCNNFCSYCVVPYTRGREKYRPQKEIIKEAKHLIKKGIAEITLVGQNVNSYPNFVGLLQKITKLPGDFKVKFLTNHPKDFSDKLIEEMAKNPKIIKYIHLPFQAGDNEVLRKMNRKYTHQDYLKLIAKIKKAMPEVIITTDIIVGFPGETRKQFEKTVEVMKKVGFKQAYIAKYSPRPGTAAFRLKDNVPVKEKQRREQIARKQIVSDSVTYICKGPSHLQPPQKLVVILGPTATGKTGLAIKLAKKFNGEIVCADSRQIYSEMAIGTASPLQNQNLRGIVPRKTYGGRSPAKSSANGVIHHLFSFVPPSKPFNVALYQKLAVKTIKDIQKRGKIPFLVGGTAFYIYSVVEGWQFPKSKANKELRKKLEAQSPTQLFEILQKLDKVRAKNIDKNNKRRLIRAIEMAKEFGKVPQLKKNPQFKCLLLGVKLEESKLKEKISARVDKMINEGLEKEVKKLAKKYGFQAPGLASVGYQEWQTYFQPSLYFCDRKNKEMGRAKEDKGEVIKEITARIKQNTWQLTKRQMTWFKKDKQIIWLKNYTQTQKLVNKFLF